MLKLCCPVHRVAALCCLMLWLYSPTPLAELIPVVEELDTDDTLTDETELSQSLASHPLSEGKYFEGDLNIPAEFIEQYYNNVSIAPAESHSLGRRAVSSNDSFLWPNGIVYYSIGDDVPRNVETTIHSAIQHWGNKTCLRFIKASLTQTDYVHFTVNDSRGCFTDWVGRKGGKQIINLSLSCNLMGAVVHEIGHTVGFWHEHSRPDRDLYVKILYENTEHYMNYQKRKYSEVDSLGVGYDYGSIMHYATVIRLDSDLPKTVIEVTNSREYEKQGSPAIGQQNELSAMDVLQANRLYYCPSNLTLIQGILKVYIRFAKDLQDTRSFGNSPDSFVRVTTVDSNGIEHYNDTAIKKGTQYPAWNEWISMYMGGRDDFWTFFKIQIWNDNCSPKQSEHCALSRSQTVWIERQPQSKKHHAASGYLWFNYNMIVDGNECRPNPCLNGGTCFDEFCSYRCTCTSDYIGSDCETRLYRGILKVTVRSASNLQSNGGKSIPSPYVQIMAVYATNRFIIKNTETRENNMNPTWNEEVNMGGNTFRAFFNIHIRDANTRAAISDPQTIPLRPGGPHSHTHNAYGDGSLQLEYTMNIDGNECSPNPCLNRGSCFDEFCSYRCTCTVHYTGTNCETRLHRGILRVWVVSASNLQYTRGSPPSPYVQITAVDASGKKWSKYTETEGNTVKPTWSEVVDMGGNTYRAFFSIRIWDARTGTAMSALETVPLSPGPRVHYHNAYGDGRLGLLYNIIIDGNECSPNPCRNDARCTDRFCNYTCTCKRGTSGRTCQTRDYYRGILKFYIVRAYNLKDTDPIYNSPDPYVRVTATYTSGTEFHRHTMTKSGTRNPIWHETINMGGHNFKPDFKIQIWDDDGSIGSDDRMSTLQTVRIQPGNHIVTHHAYRGYLQYSYNMIVDGNECWPNACQNGGTCIELIARYACSCRYGYIGRNCQYRTRRLKIKVYDGHNLPDKDPIWNESDPYVEVVATDVFYNKVRKTTSTKGGKRNPVWNEELDFGRNAWTKITLRVYDSDDNADDILCRTRTWLISRSSNYEIFKIYCETINRYVQFRYVYN